MNVFDECPSSTVNQLDWAAQMETALECYNFIAEEDDDPHNVNILEIEGSHDVQGPALEITEVTEKVKTKKVNIGIDANPKMASIGDYWDDEICRSHCRPLTGISRFISN